MEVYLIRHTTPDVVSGFIYGRMDVPLANTFLTEVAVIRPKLPPTFDIVYSSPSCRCRQLAEQITPSFLIDNRLCEFNFGDWEGKIWDDIPSDESRAWMDDFVNVSTPHGESMVQMNNRVIAFWNELISQPYQRTVIITHGGVIRLLLAAKQQLPLTSAFTINVAYGEVIRLHDSSNNLAEYVGA